MVVGLVNLERIGNTEIAFSIQTQVTHHLNRVPATNN